MTTNNFPYDRLNHFPLDDDLDAADAVIEDDRHLAMTIDHPDTWGD